MVTMENLQATAIVRANSTIDLPFPQMGVSNAFSRTNFATDAAIWRIC